MCLVKQKYNGRSKERTVEINLRFHGKGTWEGHLSAN